jgi:hypothetical protein
MSRSFYIDKPKWMIVQEDYQLFCVLLKQKEGDDFDFGRAAQELGLEEEDTVKSWKDFKKTPDGLSYPPPQCYQKPPYAGQKTVPAPNCTPEEAPPTQDKTKGASNDKRVTVSTLDSRKKSSPAKTKDRRSRPTEVQTPRKVGKRARPKDGGIEDASSKPRATVGVKRKATDISKDIGIPLSEQNPKRSIWI